MTRSSSTIASIRCVPSKVMHRVALSCFLPLLASPGCSCQHHGPPLSLCPSFPTPLGTRPSGQAQLYPGCSWPRTAKTSTDQLKINEKRSCCSTKLHCQQGPYLSGTAWQREKGCRRAWQLASRSAHLSGIRPYARAPLIPAAARCPWRTC